VDARCRYRVFIVCLVGLLAISILVNWCAYLAIKGLYRQNLLLGLHPAGLVTSERPLLQIESDPCQALVLLMGDSRVAQWHPAPRVRGACVVNIGIPGITSAQCLLAAEAELERLSPRVIVLQIGINDIKAVGAFPEAGEAILAATVENVRTLANLAAKHDCRLVLTSVIAPGDPEFLRYFVWSGVVYDFVTALNARLGNLESHGAYWLECNMFLSHNGKIRHEFSVDCFHLNHAAYEAINVRLEPLLEGLVR